MKQYDAGLLNDYGGGKVPWWHGYICAVLGRAHGFYEEQAESLEAALSSATAKVEELSTRKCYSCGGDIGDRPQCLVCWKASELSTNKILSDNVALRSQVEGLTKERDRWTNLAGDNYDLAIGYENERDSLKAKVEELTKEVASLRQQLAAARGALISIRDCNCGPDKSSAAGILEVVISEASKALAALAEGKEKA
jgi:hypothetical protein